MQLYTRKPETVEVVEVTKENEEELLLLGAVIVQEENPVVPSQKFFAVNFPTMKGPVRAQDGDFMVRGPGGFVHIPRAKFLSEFEPVV